MDNNARIFGGVGAALAVGLGYYAWSRPAEAPTSSTSRGDETSATHGAGHWNAGSEERAATPPPDDRETGCVARPVETYVALASEEDLATSHDELAARYRGAPRLQIHGVTAIELDALVRSVDVPEGLSLFVDVEDKSGLYVMPEEAVRRLAELEDERLPRVADRWIEHLGPVEGCSSDELRDTVRALHRSLRIEAGETRTRVVVVSAEET